MIRKFIKNPFLVIPYANKYMRRYKRRFCYEIRQKFKGKNRQDIPPKFIRSIQKSCNHHLKDFLRREMCCSLLSPDITKVINSFQKKTDLLQQLRDIANLVIEHKYYVLDTLWQNAYDYKNKKICWNKDVITGYEFVITHYTIARARNKVIGVDIKNIWELSRMQYLYAPALLWKITGEEQYAQCVCEVLLDWIENNPFEVGPNWSLSMEVGIRAANMMLAFELVFESDYVDDYFCSRFLTSAREHMKFILENPENVDGRTSNHYLGGILGVLTIASAFPFLSGAPKILDEVISAFESEIQKQINDDGTNIEGSTSYHRLVGEMFAIAGAICINIGQRPSYTYMQRLLAAADFTVRIKKPNGNVPQIGDNDSGRIFVPCIRNCLDHSEFINLAYAVTTNYVITDNGYINSACLMGVINLGHSTAIGACTINFSKGGYLVHKDEDVYVLLNAIDAHQYNMGDHTHNDKLSFELSVSGKEFIVDPGTGAYTADPNMRNSLRSVRSHSTISINKKEQNRLYPQNLFFLEYDRTASTVKACNSDGIAVLQGISLPKIDTNDGLHERCIIINNSKRLIIIEDYIQGKIKCVDWNFILHPDVSVAINGNKALLTNDIINVYFDAPVPITIIEGVYSIGYGKYEKTNILAAWIEGEKFSRKKYVFSFHW